jgi:hypothetical protein
MVHIQQRKCVPRCTERRQPETRGSSRRGKNNIIAKSERKKRKKRKEEQGREEGK